MSIRSKVIFGYLSQFYVTLVAIIMLPFYIKHMGAEAYGLVGFFMMLQAMFSLLDFGLSPTISRESARFLAGVTSVIDYLRLFRALNLAFMVIAALGGGLIIVFADTISTSWLSFNTLEKEEVIFSVKIMAICVALRWMCGLFRGVVIGSEKQVWFSGYNSGVATLRFVLVMPVMWMFGFTPTCFFSYQLLIAIFELLGLYLKVRLLLPTWDDKRNPLGWSFKPLVSILKFSFTIAFTSSVWILVTQTDKLVLSGILPLNDYGYFTLAVLVASSINALSMPISTVLMPRLAKLHAEEKKNEFFDIYRRSTKWVVIVAGSASITLALCSEVILLIWTGDAELANHAAPILTLYALGNGILAVGAFPYYLQYARGDLRYHLIGNIGLVLFLIPCTIYSAYHFGGVGAGYVWLVLNLIFVFFWLGYVHFKLEPGLHAQWLGRDVLLTLLPSCLFAVFIFHVVSDFSEYKYILIFLTGLFVVVLSVFASGEFKTILKYLKK